MNRIAVGIKPLLTRMERVVGRTGERRGHREYGQGKKGNLHFLLIVSNNKRLQTKEPLGGI